NGVCVDRGKVDCANYLCTTASCPSSCVDNTVCSAMNICVAMSCGTNRPLGAACTSTTDCASTFCVDGVCCQSPCSGKCQRCDLAPGGTIDGVCRVPAGQDPDHDCPGQGVCAGQCAANGTCSY